MLHKIKTIKGYALNATDGQAGFVGEFYFDDKHWALRYLIAETGNWLTSRQVLISPYVISSIDEEKQSLSLDLTKKQIENSPSLDTDIPVSRQFEEAYFSYYELPMYWLGNDVWGYYPYIERNRTLWTKPVKGQKPWDANLRSSKIVSGYRIGAIDGEIGHVDDFIIDDKTWTVRYLVIDTKNWWHGKKVLISPSWLDRVSWSQKKLYLNNTRENIKLSPEYIDNQLLTREYETSLCRHYQREGYWSCKPSCEKVICG